MKKLIKRLTVIIIVVVIILGGLAYGLTPEFPIKNENRLCNVDERINLSAINKDVIKDVNIREGNLYVDMSFNNYTFNKILKYDLLKYGNQSMEAYEFKLEGNNLIIMAPEKVGPIKTQISLYLTMSSKNNKMVLTVEKALLGKIKIPKYIVSDKIEEMGTQSDRITTDGNKIYIDLNSVDMGMRDMKIKNSKISYTLVVTREDIKDIGINLIDDMFDF